MNFPENLKYTEDHEWIKVDGDTAIVGISEFASSELGDIVFVEVESETELLDQTEPFGSIEAVKTVSDLLMPVSGEVLEVNAELEDTPELINEDPYEKGWIIKIKITNPEELDELMDSEAYADFIN